MTQSLTVKDVYNSHIDNHIPTIYPHTNYVLQADQIKAQKNPLNTAFVF